MMYHHSGYFTSHEEAGESGGHQHLPTMNYSELALMANNNIMIKEKMVLPSLFPNEGIELGLNLHHPDEVVHLGLKQQQHCYDLAMLSNPSMMRMLAAGSLNYSPEMTTESVSSAHLLFPDHDVPLFSEGFYPVSEDIKPKRPRKKKKSGPKVEKHEKERRERLNTKFSALKSLIPNPTKADRATILADAIDYIHELLRTVDELKVLVENKRRLRERRKASVAMDMESSTTAPLMDGCDNALIKGGMRSSWLQRRSRETLVDVRIVEDEVTIKIDQRRKMDSLLVISKVLDELQLELLHLSTGNIGDYHVFFFNTKIHEGSSVYASAMAERLIEVIELQPQYHGC